MAARKGKKHWTQTPEGKEHMKKMNRRRRKLQKEGKANGHVVGQIAHETPVLNGKKGGNYVVSFKHEDSPTGFAITDVPRKEVLGFIGKLMKA